MRRRIRAANVASSNTGRFAQFSKRPRKIGDPEEAALPVRHRLFHAETVEIDRDVDIFTGKAFRKFFKALAPIFTQDCAPPMSLFQWPIVRPRVDFKNSGTF